MLGLNGLFEKGWTCFERGFNILFGVSEEEENMKKNNNNGNKVKNFHIVNGISSEFPEIEESILDAWRTDVGKIPAESGGMIGSKEDKNKIDLYVFDENSKNSLASFYYDQETMSIHYRDWKSKSYKANGFVHSHPNGAIRPSYHDISTALLHMEFWGLDYFMMPIIQSKKNGFYTVYFYVANLKDGNVVTTLNYVLRATENGYEYTHFEYWSESHTVDELTSYRSRTEGKATSERNIKPKSTQTVSQAKNHIAEGVAPKKNHIDKRKLFSKVDNLLPEIVRQKVIVCVGAGGAREFLANMARNGFMNFIIIEHDTVSETNVATQAVYFDEIGRSKVEVIKEELLNINPDAQIVCVDKFLDDSMTDEEFKSYMDEFRHKKPTDYLILGCTDNFAAQERSAALALKYGTPYLAAMMYKGGAGAELIFTYPGVTPSCPRCLLRHRYEQYENGFKNDVDSASCSYFATSVMNAYKGYVAMMLLAYRTAPGSEYNNMLDEVKDRNFVWIRLSPNIKEALGIGLFDKAFAGVERYTFMGEPIWVPQTPDGERFGSDNCKLCGGTGDLRSLRNKWNDTRKICVTAKNGDKKNGLEIAKIQPLYLTEHKASGFNAYV